MGVEVLVECGCSVKDLPKGLEVGRLLSSAPGIRVGLLAWVRGRCENLGIQNTGVTKLKKIPKGVFGLVGVGVHATTRGRDGTGYKLFRGSSHNSASSGVEAWGCKAQTDLI